MSWLPYWLGVEPYCSYGAGIDSHGRVDRAVDLLVAGRDRRDRGRVDLRVRGRGQRDALAVVGGAGLPAAEHGEHLVGERTALLRVPGTGVGRDGLRPGRRTCRGRAGLGRGEHRGAAADVRDVVGAEPVARDAGDLRRLRERALRRRGRRTVALRLRERTGVRRGLVLGEVHGAVAARRAHLGAVVVPPRLHVGDTEEDLLRHAADVGGAREHGLPVARAVEAPAPVGRLCGLRCGCESQTTDDQGRDCCRGSPPVSVRHRRRPLFPRAARGVPDQGTANSPRPGLASHYA